MSINPATDARTTIEAESASVRFYAGGPASPQLQPSPVPNSGARPKQEVPNASTSSQLAEMPEDEVQVQQDSQTNGRIVIRYLDQAGDLILQVPSSQVLGLARAIDQALQQQAQARTKNGTEGGEGGNAHGH